MGLVELGITACLDNSRYWNLSYSIPSPFIVMEGSSTLMFDLDSVVSRVTIVKSVRHIGEWVSLGCSRDRWTWGKTAAYRRSRNSKRLCELRSTAS